MSYKDLDIKNCYDSGIDNIIEDFYLPVLGYHLVELLSTIKINFVDKYFTSYYNEFGERKDGTR